MKASPVPGITLLPRNADNAKRTPVARERLVSGTPCQATINAYSDPGDAFHCGIWEADPGIWRVEYSEHEFCHLLAGKLRLVDDAGTETVLVAGDSFVIPAGFSGTWEVIEPARKLYAIHEPR